MGIKILAVSFSPPARVKAYLDRYPLPIEVVCDPELVGYRAFHLKRTQWYRFLYPQVIYRYIRAIFKGTKVPVVDFKDDLLQLGGDIVIDSTGCIRWAWPSEDSTDRPSNEQILEACAGL